MNADEFEKFLKAQVNEILKYKWCLGVEMNRDPLQDRSMDEITMEWVSRYAADFRKCWPN